jgi:hypothetical protein
MNQTAQTKARYNAELYRLALARYMGETDANMEAFIEAAAEAFNVSTEKMQRDVDIKSRNFFIAANR